MVLYDERGARFAQTPLDANSERKENFGSPALASEAIVRSHSAVVSSPDLNSLSNEVSRSHLGGFTDKEIMGYENNFQTSENQTSLSFSGDCSNFSQGRTLTINPNNEINQHLKVIFDLVSLQIVFYLYMHKLFSFFLCFFHSFFLPSFLSLFLSYINYFKKCFIEF